MLPAERDFFALFPLSILALQFSTYKFLSIPTLIKNWKSGN